MKDIGSEVTHTWRTQSANINIAHVAHTHTIKSVQNKCEIDKSSYVNAYPFRWYMTFIYTS